MRAPSSLSYYYPLSAVACGCRYCEPLKNALLLFTRQLHNHRSPHYRHRLRLRRSSAYPLPLPRLAATTTISSCCRLQTLISSRGTLSSPAWRNGLLDGMFCYDGWTRRPCCCVEHIPELVADSIKDIQNSAAASLLKEGSLSVHVGGMSDFLFSGNGVSFNRQMPLFSRIQTSMTTSSSLSRV